MRSRVPSARLPTPQAAQPPDDGRHPRPWNRHQEPGVPAEPTFDDRTVVNRLHAAADRRSGMARHRVAMFAAVPPSAPPSTTTRAARAGQHVHEAASRARLHCGWRSSRHFERLTVGRITEGFGMTESSSSPHASPLLGLCKPGTFGFPVWRPTGRCSKSRPARARGLGENDYSAIVGRRKDRSMTSCWRIPS